MLAKSRNRRFEKGPISLSRRVIVGDCSAFCLCLDIGISERVTTCVGIPCVSYACAKGSDVEVTCLRRHISYHHNYVIRLNCLPTNINNGHRTW